MIDLSYLFKLLNIDKEYKQKLVNSNSILKKYFSEGALKRKPKTLKSILAKKLEDPEHRLMEQFYSLKDINKISEIEEFDELRRLNYLTEHEEKSKIKHPTKHHFELGKLYSAIEQDIKYFIGKEKEKNIEKDLPIEKQIRQRIILGSDEPEQ